MSSAVDIIRLIVVLFGVDDVAEDGVWIGTADHWQGLHQWL